MEGVGVEVQEREAVPAVSAPEWAQREGGDVPRGHAAVEVIAGKVLAEEGEQNGRGRAAPDAPHVEAQDVPIIPDGEGRARVDRRAGVCTRTEKFVSLVVGHVVVVGVRMMWVCDGDGSSRLVTAVEGLKFQGNKTPVLLMAAWMSKISSKRA